MRAKAMVLFNGKSRLGQNFYIAQRRFTIFEDLQLFTEVIEKEEEEALLAWINPLMKRKRYEGNHWDDVISRYKEVDSGSYKKPDHVQAILHKVEGLIKSHVQVKNREGTEFLTPHLIDLAPEGHIGGHVDSVKFSGDLIAGLSLHSARAMSLTPDKDYYQIQPDLLFKHLTKPSNTPLSGENYSIQYNAPHIQPASHPTSLPNKISLYLPPRSLYILQGIWRYHYAHAISLPLQRRQEGGKEGGCIEMKKEEVENKQEYRRVSVIYRNTLSTKPFQ